MRFNHPILAALGLTTLSLLSGCGGGSGTNVSPLPTRTELTPACSNAAPLDGTPDPRTPFYFVIFTEAAQGTSAELTSPLAAKYGITPRHVYSDSLKGFAADLTAEQVAGLRCEPTVDHLSYDTVLSGDGISGKN